MSNYLPNHYYSYDVLKHKDLPIYVTAEFDFYRIVAFKDDFYGKTISELHAGNLRYSNMDNRYSSIFKNKKVSYWSDTIMTARAEMKRHNKGKNFLIFKSYDDATSTFPTLSKERSPLIIVDGRDLGFHTILEKCDKKESLTEQEVDLIKRIENCEPDCLAYNSVAKVGGVNFLFFEKGFKKLSLRSVKLELGERKARNRRKILCAGTSDYIPYPEEYGSFFISIAKEGIDKNYFDTFEYKNREKIKNYWMHRREMEIRQQPHIIVNSEGEIIDE